MTANPCPAHLAAALGGIPQLAAAAAARKAADSSARLQTGPVVEHFARVTAPHELAAAIDSAVRSGALTRQAGGGVLEAGKADTLAWLHGIGARLSGDARRWFDEVQRDYAACVDALALLKSRRCTADHMVRTIDGQRAGVCIGALVGLGVVCCEDWRTMPLVQAARTALARQRTLLEGLAAEVR